MKSRAGYLISSFILLLASFLVSAIFAHLATTESLRDYNLYVPMLMGLSQLCLFGQATGITVIRFGTNYERMDKSTLTATAVATMLTSSIAVTLGLLFYASATGLNLAIALGIAVAAIGLAFRDFSINLFQISRSLTLLQIMAILYLVTLCGLLFLFPSFQTLLVGYAVVIPMALAALAVYTRRSGEAVWPPHGDVGRALLREGWPTIPGVFLGALAAFGLRSVAERSLSVTDFNAAAFAMTVSVSLFGTALGAFFRTDVISASESVAKGDLDTTKHIVDRIHGVLAGISLLTVLVSETIGESLVVGVFGSRFSGYYWVFALFAIFSGLNFAASVYSLFLQYNGRMLLSVIFSLIAPILAFCLIAWAPDLNVVWLCSAVGLANLVGLFAMLLTTRRFRRPSMSGYFLAATSTVSALLLIGLHTTASWQHYL